MRAWLTLFAAACTAPPEAPETLDELARYLYREWDDPDPAVLVAGVDNLEAFLADVDLTGAILDRSWALADLTADDIAGVDHPDRDPALAVGIGAAWESRWPVTDHAQVQIRADQTPFEPTAREHYDRTFLTPDDPGCFADQTCPILSTVNDATRQNVLMSVTFELFKDIRWVERDTPDRWAMLSRSWYDQPWTGESGNVTLWQSYSVDLWIGRGDRTWRFQTIWSETDLGASVSESTVIGTLKGATDQLFKACDEAIATEIHGE